MENTNEVRAYTMEEIRGEFLTSLYASQSVLDKQEKRDGLSIAYTVLSTIDEGEPLYEIIPTNHEEDIAGELHSLILRSDEELNTLQNNGKISDIQRHLIEAVKKASKKYDACGINNSHILTSEILRIIDHGVNGITFELKAIGNPEDIEYYKNMETNYYPEQGENIAGKLAVQYNRIVDACKTKTTELETMFLVPQVEIIPPKHM